MTETEEEYFQICAWRKLHPLPKTEYGEVHHVLPKSCGGPNHKWNLVRLTPEEHYRCHCLLPKIFEEKGQINEQKKTLCAWNFMRNTKTLTDISEEEYGQLRRQFVLNISGENNPRFGVHLPEETRKKLSEAHIGIKTWLGKHHTEETKKKIGKIHKGKTISEEQKKRISEFNKGKVVSEETRAKMSAWQKGLKKKPLSEDHKKKIGRALKGRKFSEEHRQRIAAANTGHKHTEEAKRKMSAAKKGKSPWNKGKITKRPIPLTLLPSA